MGWNGSDRAAGVKKGGDNDRPQWGDTDRPRWGGRHGWWVAIGAMVVLAGGIWLATGTGGDDGEPKVVRKLARSSSRARATSPQQAVGAAMSGVEVKPSKKRARRVNVEMFSHLSGEDRRMAEQVQSAMDSDDLKATIAAVTESLASTNVEVRMNAVDALGWFGSPVLPELAGAMADADEDVRQTAENHFEQALQEIEHPRDRLKIALAAFATLSDEDQLASLGGIIDGAATELIDGEADEDKASEYRVDVIQELVYIMDDGNASNVKAAQELYNDITGNEWLGIEEAERYLSDPENYMPPDENAEEAVPTEKSVEKSAETMAAEPAEAVTEPAEEGQPDQSEEAAEEDQAETQEEKSGETEEEDQSEAAE